MHESPARAKLVEWIAVDGHSQAQIARALAVSQPSVHAWVRGAYRPEQHYRQALEALTGIPAADWELEEERTKRDEALARINADPSPGTHGTGGE